MKTMQIIGLLIKDRIKEAGKTQLLLSEYAELINSRLGFHETTESTCSRVGFVVLQLQGDVAKQTEFVNKLKCIDGVEVQNMEFKY